MRFSVISVAAGIAGVESLSPDLCTQLCVHDGVRICTRGSYTKPDGSCQSYVFRGNPDNGDYCYHTSETARTCPGMGVSVHSTDVPRLLGRTTQSPELTTTVQPTTQNALHAELAGLVAEAAAREGQERAGRIAVIAQRMLTALSDLRPGESPLERWTAIGGSQLMELASQDGSIARGIALSVIRAALSVPIAQGDEREFATTSGLRIFCDRFADQIRAALVPLGEHVNPTAQFVGQLQQWFFVADLPLYCPNIFRTEGQALRASLRRIAVRYYVYRRMHSFRSFSGPSHELAVEAGQAFSAAIPALEQPVESLVLGLTWVRLNSDRGATAVQSWMQAAGRELSRPIFDLLALRAHDRQIYAEESPGGDSLSWSRYYRAAGRFLALALINEVPLGQYFSHAFFAFLLDQVPTLADIRYDAPSMFAQLTHLLNQEGAEAEQEVNRQLSQIISRRITRQLGEIRRGFDEILDISNFGRIIPARDLRALIGGLHPELPRATYPVRAVSPILPIAPSTTSPIPGEFMTDDGNFPSPTPADGFDQNEMANATFYPIAGVVSTAAPTTSVAQSVAAQLASRIEQLAARPDQAALVLAAGVNVAVYRFLAARRNANLSPRTEWESINGPLLLATASRSSALAHALAQPILRIALNLNVSAGEEARFASAIGLEAFCDNFAEVIRGAILPYTIAQPQQYVGQDNEFLAQLPLYCPNIVDSPVIARIVLNHLARRRRAVASLRSNGNQAILSVSRLNAFGDALSVLTGDANVLAAGIWQARFEGEAATGQGVIRDWFVEAARQMFDPAYGLFEIRTEEPPHFARISPLGIYQDDWQRWYRGVGRFLALSLLQERPIGVSFPLSFYASLLGQELELEDIEEEEPVLSRSLSLILEMSDEDLANGEFELVSPDANGQLVTVTPDNREGLVYAAVNGLMDAEVAEQMAAIRQGFDELFPIAEVSRLVTADDVRAAIVGSPEIDVDDLMEHVALERYRRTDPQIHWLHETLRNFDQEDRQRFLRFVTSTAQVPIGGFQFFPRISIDATGQTHGLPTASTGGYQLHLPRYSSAAELEHALTTAIRADSAMGIV